MGLTVTAFSRNPESGTLQAIQTIPLGDGPAGPKPGVTSAEIVPVASLPPSVGSSMTNTGIPGHGLDLATADAAFRVYLHSPAMLLALVVFLLEQILGNRFYPSRATNRSSSPTRGPVVASSSNVGAA